MTTPTGTDNPFNWNVDDDGNVDIPSRLTDSPTETYEFDYDYGGSQDDPLNSATEQVREDARELNVTLQGNQSDGSMFGAVAVLMAIIAAAIALFGGD